MNLILLTFGERLENHYQASFAILSFLKDPAIQRVIVVTDYPEFYAFFNEKVEMVQINQEILKEWQGTQQFFWRIKIKALELIQKKYPNEHLFYIDSDTFLAKNLCEIEKQLSNGIAFMHKYEHKLQNNVSNTTTKMYNSLNGQSFAGIRVTAESEMWNAGVIGLPKDNAETLIQRSLMICDEICATSCPRRLVEQFAFSLALANHGLQPCDSEIGHYWGNKDEWNKAIMHFMAHAFLKKLSLIECVELLKTFNWHSLPINKKQRNMNIRLKATVNRLFPDKNHQFFN